MTVAVENAVIAAWDNPPGPSARGTVIVVPGRGEHPRVYERFGARLAFDAYLVRAVADPTRDEAGVTATVHALLADPDLVWPKVLVGSDAGAAFALSLVATGQAAPAGLILAGLPAGGAVGTTDWDAELAERTACPTHAGRLSADPDFRRGGLQTPVPSTWLAAGDLSAVTVPVLGLHGTADELSPLREIRERFAAAPTAELISIVDGRHDALNDATHRTAAAMVVLFLERLRLGTGRRIATEEVRVT